MKNFLIYILAIAALVACKAQSSSQQSIYGTFYNRSKNLDFNYEYKLQLNVDGSFLLNEKHKDANPQCKGNWKRIGQDTIFLKCSEVVDATEMLSNGYMNKREYKLKIVDKNRIRYNGVILKRIE